jgi:two-component system NtrC family sensor kinase
VPASPGPLAAVPPAAPPAPWHRRLLHRVVRALARLALGRDVTAELRADRARLSRELSQRLGELYSLQELAHVLSASLRFDDVTAEVARYAMRALDASGAVVLLAPEQGGAFEVVAAKGVLSPHLRRRVDPESGGLVLEAIGHERLELRTGEAGSLTLFAGVGAGAAVAAPLRAHGVTVGAIAVVDKLVGTFTADDARLLSTAATHAAVVLANARFFELVRDGKEQWEATFDALAEGIALVDQGHVIRRANDAMAAILGEPVSRIIGRPLGEALFRDNAVLGDLVAAAALGRRPPPIVRRTQEGRILRVASSPLSHPTADVAAVVVVEDITEQKALETQLMQSEKLASVGTMVSGVAHELNNPLTSIAGLSEFLLEQGPEGDPSREHLRVINDQAERASRIVRNLLSFARKSPAERGPLDLGDIAQRTVMLMSYELRRAGITVETDIQESLPPVLGNRDQLQQVMLNLLTNAAYALGLVPDDAPRHILVGVRGEGERVVLRVQDSGIGIAPEAAAQLFDPFFTTKPPGEGTGLGLFLSFGIAETHGGTLTADSAPGAGATFMLALPAATAGAHPAPESARAIPPRVATPPRRVLMVDDDPAVRRLVTVLFGHDGHAVDAAQDGVEGLRLARQHEYDLVLIDRRAAAGAEPFAAALLREHPAWRSRTLVAAADRPSGVLDEATASLRLLRKPFNLRDLRTAAAAVWDAGS